MTNLKQARDALEKGIFVHTDAPLLTKALDALERLEGVDLEGLEEGITKYRNQSGYTLSGIDAQRFFYVAGIVADIKKEMKI